MRPTLKWMDAEGNEVGHKEATHILFTEYDEEGNVTREVSGALGDALDNHQVDEHDQS